MASPPRRTIAQPTPPPTPAGLEAGPRAGPPTNPASTLIAPLDLAAPLPTRTAAQTIGFSVEGRPIDVYRFGGGARAVLLVGGIHGGYEANTVVLMRRLIAHFQAEPGLVPTAAALWIVPAANPDGLNRGGGPPARFNGRSVDLNRNWACGWQPTAQWRDEPVNPGLAPFSEPETQALSAWMLAEPPAAALFFHSALGAVFPGSCGNAAASQAMAARFAEASGFPCCAPFTAYAVAGTAADWAASVGIPAADVELFSRERPEFDQVLPGVMALLRWAGDT